MVTIYAKQSNPLIERVLLKGRSRFRSPLILAKQEGIRGILKALRSGRPFYYLPDMDYGARDAVFVPFFGVQAATITGAAVPAGSSRPLCNRQSRSGACAPRNRQQQSPGEQLAHAVTPHVLLLLPRAAAVGLVLASNSALRLVRRDSSR